MRVPLDWLQTFFQDALPATDRLVELLDGLGLAVELVEELPAAPGNVVVAEIRTLAPVEGSDHLQQVVAFDGRREVQVVCGAPNARVGMRSALAHPGALLPGVGLEVRERDMLGVASRGVLASPKELGLYDAAGGLIAFGADVPLGTALADVWPATTVIELELTPNRADAFSLLGVARDLSAKLGLPLLHPSDGLDPGDASLDDDLELEIEDSVGAPRFTLRAIEGVTVAPSPVWLQRRLAALGLRPRNNVVDVTNYVTFELGQPSHAYDKRVLGQHPGGAGTSVAANGPAVLQVRRAKPGERVALLNEETIDLDPDDLVIATPGLDGASRAIGLAGVMGGLHDSVVADTRDVALEVAAFEPVTVRRSARRHKLVTDARIRFERGVDPNLQPRASARAAALIQELAGGRVHPGLSAFGSHLTRPSIAFRPSRVHFLMDVDVAPAEQRRYLEALGCDVDESGADEWRVTPPSWRFDMTLEEDVVEEVGRLHGYEHIGTSVPAMAFVPPAGDPTHRVLRARLAAMGLQETMTYVFTGEGELARAAAPAPVVRLQDPQGVERSVLRTALYPGLLAAAQLNRFADALALFEVGHVFLSEEEERVAVLLRGPRTVGGWRPDQPTDFFVLKGLLEHLAALDRAELEVEPAPAPQLHPGVAARVRWNGEEVGFAGRLHPEVAARYELPETYLAELRLPLAGRRIRFDEIARQPHAERDLAVIAPDDVGYAALAALCRAAAGDRLVSLAPFDVYQGEQLPTGMRSVALRFRFRHPERALTDDEVDGVMRNVIQAVRSAGYDIRA